LHQLAHYWVALSTPAFKASCALNLSPLLSRKATGEQPTILFIVPVLGLLGILVRNGGLNLVPVLRLLVIGVLNLLLLIPVLRLLGIGILDLLQVSNGMHTANHLIINLSACPSP